MATTSYCTLCRDHERRDNYSAPRSNGNRRQDRKVPTMGEAAEKMIAITRTLYFGEEKGGATHGGVVSVPYFMWRSGTFPDRLLARAPVNAPSFA